MTRETGVAEMTAVVRREHAAPACFTGATGALVLAIAFVMMLLAAPSHPHLRPHGAAPVSAQTVSEITQTLTSAVSPGTRPPAISPGTRRP